MRRIHSAQIEFLLICCILSARAFVLPETTRSYQRTMNSNMKEAPVATGTTAWGMNVIPVPRKRQIRRKPSNKRPRNYWTKTKNIAAELHTFWAELHVLVHTTEPPPIPNEALLNHFRRFDLKNAIVAHGGREMLSDALGTARIMPGKWAQAVKTSPELQRLLLQGEYGLSPEYPPLSPQQQKEGTINTDLKGNGFRSSENRWEHQKDRKPKGYWNETTMIIELYEYLEECQESFGRPSVWMPRPSEIGNRGRADLKLAISRFGGVETAKLVSFRDWYWFEGQLEMLVELKQYLDKYHGGSEEFFPSVTDIQKNGYDQLYNLVQFFGGRKFLASKLDMKCTNKELVKLKSEEQFCDIAWGAFSVNFAVQLLQFIRAEQMKMKPPLKRPEIFIPSRSILLSSGDKGKELDREIEEFGGYENVARRLGLAYFKTNICKDYAGI